MFKAPGLHHVRRTCSRNDPYAQTAGVSVTSTEQDFTLVASVPLTSEALEPYEEGDVIAIANGTVKARRSFESSGAIQ